MKKMLLFLAASTLMVACKSDTEYEISGTVDPSLNGKNIILEKTTDTGFVPLDTAVVADGKFSFKGTVTEPSLRFITIADPAKKIDFILENGDINLKVDKDSLHKTERSGTFNNDKMAEYYKSSVDVRNKITAFQKKNYSAMMEAYQKGDTVVMNKLNKEYNAIAKSLETNTYDFLDKNPDSFVSVLILKQLSAQIESIGLDKVKKHYNSLTAEMKKTAEGKEIADAIKKLESPAKAADVSVGKPAPYFSAPSPEGKNVSLKESLGKVTIIDFWASWCKPCRAENPNVVALYNELHSKGLNIIGVSLDKTADAWKTAIKADNLTWPQVSNLKFWDDPVAKQYGVQSIPATFILDANGVIVARDLRGAELKAKVQELLAK